MSTIAELDAPSSRPASIADLVAGLGDIPLHRIRMNPPPGSATIADVERTKCCELIDGTLVEKAMGLSESFLAAYLIQVIREFVVQRKLGLVAGPDGTWGLAGDLVRLPDVAFVSWSRLRGSPNPKAAVPQLAPDLAIEVLSPSNSKAEMVRKRRELFAAGVRQVWIVDRFSQTVAVYSSADEHRILTSAESLDGGDILPGFALSVAEIFKADRDAE